MKISCNLSNIYMRPLLLLPLLVTITNFQYIFILQNGDFCAPTFFVLCSLNVQWILKPGEIIFC